MNDRTTFIGGSEIAALLGIAPKSWEIATPLDLYLSKIGELKLEDKPVFKRGKRWESTALDMLLDNIEDNDGPRPLLICRNQRYIDNKHNFLSVEIDAEIQRNGERMNVEIKTVTPFKSDEWGDEESCEMPLHVAAQAMFGLGVTGRDRCIVGALFGADVIKPFYVERDDETIKGIREKAIEFWRKHVLERVPPDPVNMADMMTLFKKVNGKPCELDEVHWQMLEQRRLLKDEIKLLEKKEQNIEFGICDFIRRQWATNLESCQDDAILIFGDKIVGSWKKQRGTHLDQKRLAQEHPDIIEQYTNEHFFRVLRMKGK